ncbi:MAG: terpene cyclase/mutase family protein [Bacillati bacterium ANGP1]|uniref:Terpene cyclase/mutase family protein n=1 Tax=Candidatus Segetimicrobium genomatis TaxID=2569760 RepID=A0A537JI33_9BACT|nr:MAG: terpene cyclase/mutase family protein [Terrabacteria group bacterium ANGP1]
MARAIDTEAVALPAGAYDWRRTIAWIDHNGNETERARLRGLLGRPRPEAKVIRTLEARQNDDGGFPSELIQGRPSSIDTTALVLRWLQDLGTLAGAVAQRVVTYLFTVQRPDGSWDQPPGLVRYGPPPRLLPGDSRVQALCTAQAAYWLVLLGHRHDHAVSRAMGYLRARQAADGRFLGYIRTTWMAAALFRCTEGPGSAVCARALDALGAVEAERWSAGALVGMLNCMAEAGVSTRVPVVRQGVARLRALAEPTGSWPSEDGEFYRVEVSLRALRVLLLYGAVSEPMSEVEGPQDRAGEPASGGGAS